MISCIVLLFWVQSVVAIKLKHIVYKTTVNYKWHCLNVCPNSVSFQKINEEILKEVVLSFLPDLSGDTLTSLLELELGMENREDLDLVQEKDLEKYLRPIQSEGNPIFETIP